VKTFHSRQKRYSQRSENERSSSIRLASCPIHGRRLSASPLAEYWTPTNYFFIFEKMQWMQHPRCAFFCNFSNIIFMSAKANLHFYSSNDSEPREFQGNSDLSNEEGVQSKFPDIHFLDRMPPVSYAKLYCTLRILRCCRERLCVFVEARKIRNLVPRMVPSKTLKMRA
jgi:hypothetical protein